MIMTPSSIRSAISELCGFRARRYSDRRLTLDKISLNYSRSPLTKRPFSGAPARREAYTHFNGKILSGSRTPAALEDGREHQLEDLNATIREPTESASQLLVNDEEEPRLPRSVQAIYLKPLKRQAKYGVPSCDLQLRSYSVRNVEFFADFALRTAYYLKLPAAGPIPLPRITERWTVPRSNFIHKKSQENFERITLRRLIQVQDGHPETVEVWLAYLRKHAYYGIGMKANVWQYERIGVGKGMDSDLEDVKQALEPRWASFEGTSQRVAEILNSKAFRDTSNASMSS